MRVPQQISNPISENLAKLSELFPAAVKDGALDVAALRAELGDFEEIKPGDETYELNWVGKQAAKKEAFKPLLGKTLALKDDGKNSDTTQNLYIEGDNLEALKLLRQNYYGEVKVIYIDPPYNTGKDFVYRDNFTAKIEESEQEEGAVSESGQRLIKNEKTSNRFHARWLDMMYPRLKLAKDLLRENGAIFISIDDNEVANLRVVCDEVFGEANFVGSFKWNRVAKAPSLSGSIRSKYEYVLAYFKSEKIKLFGKKSYNTQGPLWHLPNKRNELTFPAKSIKVKQSFKKGQYGGSYDVELLDDLIEEKGVNAHPVRVKAHSAWGQNKIDEYTKSGETFEIKKSPTTFYTTLSSEDNYIAPSDLITKDECGVGTNTEASDALKKMDIPFEYPKPVALITYFVNMATHDDESAIVLDFYSGSAVTAHAVMHLNAEDGGKRRYIMVQLTENCAIDSDAAKSGYKTIPEIGKERIRRAGEKIKEDLQTKHAEWKKKQALESKKGGKLDLEDELTEETNPYVINPDSLDIGFKSFSIEDTKINWLKKDLRGEQLEFDDTTTQDALDFVPGYTDTDVVYELMLRQSNIPLTGTITKPITTAKRTYLYADAYLICLEEKITQKLVESLATIEPTPNKYFFRDSAFGTDIALKDETFRRLKAEIHKHHGDLGAAYTVEFI
jgi:adenine-specific DNA-methyltransferase